MQFLTSLYGLAYSFVVFAEKFAILIIIIAVAQGRGCLLHHAQPYFPQTILIHFYVRDNLKTHIITSDPIPISLPEPKGLNFFWYVFARFFFLFPCNSIYGSAQLFFSKQAYIVILRTTILNLQNYYSVLGVEENAMKSEIKTGEYLCRGCWLPCILMQQYYFNLMTLTNLAWFSNFSAFMCLSCPLLVCS